MSALSEPAFWIALAEIMWVNVLLSGDNAVVIALAARKLGARRQRAAIVLGSLAAIVLRVVLTLFAVRLLDYPFLKLGGALFLVWIGISLLSGDEDHDAQVVASDGLWTAIRTILVADLVMSLDNVIAVAAAAQSGPPASRLTLLIVGLGLSIPLIIFGSTLLLQLMKRVPAVVTLGAGLLGFVAGTMALDDPWVVKRWGEAPAWLASVTGAATAALVIAVGKLRQGPPQPGTPL